MSNPHKIMSRSMDIYVSQGAQMATKKQKRIQAIARHKAFMDEYRMSGLRALLKDKERRAQKDRDEWRENHDKNHSWKKRIKECPLCADEIKAQKQAIAEAS